MKHWFTSTVHTKCTKHPHPPFQASVEHHEAFTEDVRTSWILMWATPLETQQNLLSSAPRNSHCAKTHTYTRAVQYTYMHDGAALSNSLSLSLSPFLILSLTSGRPTHIQMLSTHTHMNLQPPTRFHVYVVWLQDIEVHIFTFPSWGSNKCFFIGFCNSASLLGTYSNVQMFSTGRESGWCWQLLLFHTVIPSTTHMQEL